MLDGALPDHRDALGSGTLLQVYEAAGMACGEAAANCFTGTINNLVKPQSRIAELPGEFILWCLESALYYRLSGLAVHSFMQHLS
jgi:hypothetical protein